MTGGFSMIGSRIKDLREQNGFTQTSLAKKLGLSRSAINAWEMGVSVPSTQYLMELARLFKVSADYLLGIDTAEKVDISHLNSTEKEIIYSLLRYFRYAQNAAALLQELGYGSADKDYEEMLETLSEIDKDAFSVKKKR